MCKLIIGLLLILNCICIAEEKNALEIDDAWLMKANTIDEDAVEWLKEHLKERLSSESFLKNPLEEEGANEDPRKCQGCGSAPLSIEELSPLYVFMSFSLEDKLWIQFSRELEKIGGVFVIRGLPKNSFKELANRIFELQQKGVNVPIQIHPNLFRECDVQLVPTIAAVEEKKYDKITGNLSIGCALEKMAPFGETQLVKEFYRKYKEAR